MGPPVDSSHTLHAVDLYDGRQGWALSAGVVVYGSDCGRGPGCCDCHEEEEEEEEQDAGTTGPGHFPTYGQQCGASLYWVRCWV